MLSFCRNVLHLPAAQQAIYLALNDFFPGDRASSWCATCSRGCSQAHLAHVPAAVHRQRHLRAAGGGAQSRLGRHENRSYLKNQLVSLGMIFACGGLALLSLMLTALNRRWISTSAPTAVPCGSTADVQAGRGAGLDPGALPDLLAAAEPEDRTARVAPVAIVVGLILEALKYVNLLRLAVSCGRSWSTIYIFRTP